MAGIIDDYKLDRLKKLLEKPRTAEELSRRLGRSTRTVYRWLNLLEKEGFEVVQVGDSTPCSYLLEPE